MGEECPRPVASGSEHYIGQVVSSRAQNGENLGGEADGKGCVARGSRVCRESRYRQVSAARPPPDLCTALPRRGRRTGADPVSARSHFHSENRTISRLQTADSRCRQRQNRDRTARLSGLSSVSDLPTIQEKNRPAIRLVYSTDGRFNL